MLNKKYQSIQNAVASYDYFDIEEGTGYVIYYGYQETDSTGTYYKLSRTAMYSYKIEKSATSTTGDYVKIMDLDFDVLFNKPQIIRGKTKFSMQYHHAGGGSPECYLIFKVRKWDNSTETELGSVQSVTFTAGTTPQVLNLSCMISQTNFKKSETLRVTVEVWARSNDGTTHTIAFDPKNRTGAVITTAPTIFEVHVPFLVDVD